MVKSTLLIKQVLLACSIAISAFVSSQSASHADTIESLEAQNSPSSAQTLPAVESTPLVPEATPSLTEQPTLEQTQQASEQLNSEPVASESVASEAAELPNAPDSAMGVEPMEAPAEATAEVMPATTPADAVSAEPNAPTAAEAPSEIYLNPSIQTPTGTAADLLAEPVVPSLTPMTISEPGVLEESQPIRQAQTFGQLERRFTFSYIGVGANIGITGDPALGDTSFAVLSKIALNPYLSARPSALFGDDVSFLLPVTYDFAIAEPGGFAPFVGGGLAISTGDGEALDLLLTAGLDVPVTDTVALTASANIAPFDTFDFGVLLGVSYIFDSRTVVTRSGQAVVSDTVDEVTDAAGNVIAQLPAGRSVNPSFIGVGGNIGIGGDTALSDSSFAVVSKFTIADYVSLRPSLLIGDSVTALVPVTYDFAPIRTEYITLAPYLGAGFAVTFDDDSEFDLLLSGGLDIPVTDQIAVTTGINFAVLDSFDIGALIGIVYTFDPF
ncbi:hypothetical protein ACQ4M4_12565 [Leptolyngbya sp. AN02str]|uniref:hypothetical protein n=1 Tax=Leptolyngbya sp. AN02str TaxID=3423363 RepID=UPI003D31FE66